MAKQSKDSQSKKTNGDGPTEGAPEGGEPIAATPFAGATRSGAGAGTGTEAQLSVLAQYIKDLSFESPSAPQSLQKPGENPQLRVGVNVNAGPRGKDVYEVVLNLEVHAKSDAGVIYNVELVYGGLFGLRNIPEHLLQPVLFVDCPTLLFPFMRRVLADISRDGGFPPLMLDPIDFGRLYAQNLAKAQAEPQPQAKN